MKRFLSILAVAGAALTVPAAAALADTFVGTDASERIQGTPSPDQLYGEAGDDTLVGLAGSYFI
jgi:hypothetical protein